MCAEGRSRREIARELGISRNTVAKYASREDFSPEPPTSGPRTSPTMEPHAATVESWLEGDAGRPRKQRHTARRVYDRLVAERGFAGSLATVERFVREWRREHAGGPGEGFLELEWPCGTCQVDYGRASAVVAGEEVGLHELAVSWPHSNARFCVMCESERGECLVDGLMTVFDHVGGVPPEAVLDNATEAGRRVAGVVRESSLFSAFRAHTGMRTKYCNPYSGHEKGSVENAVGFLRRNMMVPLPVVSTVAELNAHLLARCDALLAEPHYRTGRPVCDMFAEDQSAMLPLPATPFDAVRWERRTADRDGRVEVDGVLYLAGPSWRGWHLLVGLRARSVEVVDGRGRHVVTLPRKWRDDGETVRDPASLIPALSARPRAWDESPVRRDLPAPLVDAVDLMGAADRRRALRSIERAARRSGFGPAVEAAAEIAASGRVPDEGSVDVLARRIAQGLPSASGSADLAVYDSFLRGGER